MPGRDSDGFTEDELAQIIPLRRRAHEPPDRDPYTGESERVGVFDPPEEPEPAREYSVWEQPIAELIRREPDDPLPSPRLRHARSSLHFRRPVHFSIGDSLGAPCVSSSRTKPSLA
jgi:hypothetical protein